MKVFTYSEARRRLAEVLDQARSEDVMIARRNGESFLITRHPEEKSPLDVPMVKSHVTTDEIIDVIRESRAGR